MFRIDLRWSKSTRRQTKLTFYVPMGNNPSTVLPAVSISFCSWWLFCTVCNHLGVYNVYLSVIWRLKMCQFYGRVNWEHVVRLLHRSWLLLGESVIGSSTVYMYVYLMYTDIQYAVCVIFGSVCVCVYSVYVCVCSCVCECVCVREREEMKEK